ncbi:MAG: TRL domain-containing protein [Bacteroidia bacterium]|jgi:hypothetical protein
MNKLKSIVLAAVVMATVSSCALTLPVTATENPVGTRVGTSKATGYFNILWFNQDASIRTAAKNGGITKISTVDIKWTSILGIIVGFETTVTGE